MSDFEFDDDLDLDDAGLAELDQLEHALTTGAPLPPKSIIPRNLVQKDLFGGTVKPKPAPVASTSRVQVGGKLAGKETVAKVKNVKKWDKAAFAKHGWSKKRAAESKARAKGKGKGRAYASDEEAWDEDEVMDSDDDDELLDPNFDPDAPLPDIKWPPDPETSKTWQYPVQPDKPLRTYQYNIVHHALFENTLVSLPTGLGKTFIAACIMLNFYRWYPHGKVIFLAPTRPLVTQQIKACHYIAGIRQEDSVELTGQTAPKLRAIAWATKRVIYCTPQTLENDLAKGRVDPRDITCLVVDEAHRASGDYAYCGVVRYMMSRNQHFRVLALTATPGSKGEAVQAVIDNLHIGKIEVRTDESMDIKQYMHTKAYDLQVIPLGDGLGSIRDRWARLMQPYLGPLNAASLVWEKNASMLSPYAVQMANGKIKDLPGGAKGNSKYYPMIKVLSTMARAMEYLVIQSMTSFESILKDLAAEGPKSLTQSPIFKDLVKECNFIRASPGYVGHPKMDNLIKMCSAHFEEAQHELDDYGQPMQTRVMIFCNFRAVVDEIVDCLNRQRPLIKATAFVGQASSKGAKGKSQKEQIETIKKFKDGVYNVLVATSIGEEGLDIGEIDLIVCYEANKSPIRMLQRVGRTGRARDGKIIVLMTEGREEKNWDKAKDAYADVQNALVSNKVFECYVDGDRMLPKHIKPENDKVVITAKPLDLNTMTMAGQGRIERKTSAEEKKQAKKRDPKLNMPNDAFIGFRTAGQLAHAASKPQESPEEVMRQRRRAALLTTEQETTLRQRWQYAGNKKVVPVAFNLSELPFELGSTGSTSRIPTHSTVHLSALTTLRTMQKLDDSHIEALDEWYEKSSAAFNSKLVDVWDKGKSRDGRRPHTRVVRTPPEPEPSSSEPSATFLQEFSPPLSFPPVKSAPFRPPAAISKVAPPPKAAPVAAPLAKPIPKPIIPPAPIIRAPATKFAPAPPPATDFKRSVPPPPPDDSFHLSSSDDADFLLIECDEAAVKPSEKPLFNPAQPSSPPPLERSSFKPPPSSALLVPDSDDDLPKPPKSSSGFRFAGPPPPPAPAPAPPAPAPVPAYDPVEASIEMTPEVFKRPAMKRRKQVVESSSPQSSAVRGGPRRMLPQSSSAHKGDTSVEISKPLNRLRRGRVAEGDLSLEAEEEEEVVRRPKKKKPKRLTEKQAAKHGLFNTEAVNSDASATEASSEEYDSENSIDREFVGGSEDYDDSPGMARFRQESLLSQAPGFANPVFRPGAYKMSRGVAMPHSSGSGAPEPDEWSYDSFCVGDDEEIEYEDSSEV
ncbi:ATP-dependent DNA helicase MPH1 [Pseudohyphozyma bogoriensis]|nr:ATP-dependent DNA helicase MPH1 [Pseudohyphozyma bogoriensis]